MKIENFGLLSIVSSLVSLLMLFIPFVNIFSFLPILTGVFFGSYSIIKQTTEARKLSVVGLLLNASVLIFYIVFFIIAIEFKKN